MEAQPARTLCLVAGAPWLAPLGPASRRARTAVWTRSYDAVRAYEPCIVVSDAEKHTFKYVVLSDRLIYLTENPPKSIRRVVALRDVVAIDLVSIAGGRSFLNSRIPLLHWRKEEEHLLHPAHDFPTSSCQ